MADDDLSTQSVDDATDTASGGLQNDMPGVPRGSPQFGGGRPPSPLSAIAQLFTGSQAPRPAQPGRSPFQFPGVSQINPNMGGAPGPQGRWQGTTASIGLPRGSIQPRAMFTPFMSSAPTDSHTQWGQEELFPDLPQSHELPGLYGNLANFFSKTGSQSLIPLALSMKLNTGQFVEGLMKGQEWQAKMAREKLQDDALKAATQQQNELMMYSDEIDKFLAASHQTDPSKIGSYMVDGRTLGEAMGEVAVQIGDKNMEALAGNGDVDAMLRYNHLRNDQLRNLTKANAAMEKQDAQDREEQAIWGQSFGGGGQSQANPAESGAAITPGGAAQRSPFAPGQGRPAPTVSPGDQQQQQQGDPNATSADPTNPSADTPWANDVPAVQQAERLMATGRGVKLEDKRANDYITKQALEMQERVDRDILKNPKIGPDVVDPKTGEMISSPVEDALNREFGGHFAEDSRGIAYYTAGLGGGMTGQGGGGGPEQNYNKLLQDLAGKRRPGDYAKGVSGYQQRNYQLITDFEKDQRVQTAAARVSTVATTGQQLSDAVDAFEASATPEAKKQFQDQVNAINSQAQSQNRSWFDVFKDNVQAGMFTGSHQAVALLAAYQNYNIEKNVLLRSGQGGIGETREAESIIPRAFARPEDYRVVLAQDAENAKARTDQNQSRFRSLGGQGFYPGAPDRGAYDTLVGFANYDWVNLKHIGDHATIAGHDMVYKGKYNEDGTPRPRNEWWEPAEGVQ